MHHGKFRNTRKKRRWIDERVNLLKNLKGNLMWPISKFWMCVCLCVCVCGCSVCMYVDLTPTARQRYGTRVDRLTTHRHCCWEPCYSTPRRRVHTLRETDFRGHWRVDFWSLKMKPGPHISVQWALFWDIGNFISSSLYFVKKGCPFCHIGLSHCKYLRYEEEKL